MIARRETLLAPLALAVSVGVLACAARRRPCSSADGCGDVEVCEVGRCAPSSALPASSTAHRTVSRPADVRVADDSQNELRAGGSAGGQLLLVRFDTALPRANVESAFLVLTPLPAAPPASAPIDLVVSRVHEGWSSSAPAWPRIGPVEARARASFAPPAPVRIDVTTIVREWARTGNTPHGFAVRSSGGEGIGALFATGLGGAEGPTLDVYTR